MQLNEICKNYRQAFNIKQQSDTNLYQQNSLIHKIIINQNKIIRLRRIRNLLAINKLQQNRSKHYQQNRMHICGVESNKPYIHHLVLTYNWYDKIAQGNKTKEYRALKLSPKKRNFSRIIPGMSIKFTKGYNNNNTIIKKVYYIYVDKTPESLNKIIQTKYCIVFDLANDEEE